MGLNLFLMDPLVNGLKALLKQKSNHSNIIRALLYFTEIEFLDYLSL